MSDLIDKLIDRPPAKQWRKFTYELKMQVRVFEAAAKTAKKGGMSVDALVEELLREFNAKVARADKKKEEICKEKKKKDDARRAARWLRQTTSTAYRAMGPLMARSQSRGRAAQGRRRAAGRGFPPVA